MALQAFLAAGKKGDPIVYVELVGKKRALLFDCGEFHLTTAHMRKISDMCISHTHMDHFVGFDRILRASLVDDKILTIHGPQGIIKNVCGKIASYTWNITDKLLLKIKVKEYDGKNVETIFMDSRNQFTISKRTKKKDTSVVIDDDDIQVRYASCYHKIRSYAYSVKEKLFFNVRKDKLEELKLEPGPWLADLKNRARFSTKYNEEIIVAQKKYTVGFLKDELLLRRSGTKITFVVDVLFSPENIKKITKLAQKSSYFFCETPFLEADLERATETCHLTAKQAGILARQANVHLFIPMHISKRYKEVEPILEEAKKEFGNIK